MAVSSMLKVQLLGHDSIRDRLKEQLRESGVIEITEAEPSGAENDSYPAGTGELSQRIERLAGSISFLEDYIESPTLWEKLNGTAIRIGSEKLRELASSFSVDEASERCSRLEGRIRELENDADRKRELITQLEPWRGLGCRMDQLEAGSFRCRLWSFQAGASEEIADIEKSYEISHFEKISEDGARIYMAVIEPTNSDDRLEEAIKKAGGIQAAIQGLEGTPAQIIEAGFEEIESADSEIEKAAREAEQLAGEILDDLYILIDYYREQLALTGLEGSLFRTQSVFMLEGWVRELDRNKLEKSILENFEEVEIAFRKPKEDENPPVHLDNSSLVEPNEFVMTLYGNPQYRELDPTPFFAPFFILFFAMCLTDAGYGAALSLVSAFVLIKFRPSGGAGKLMKLLLAGGAVTTVVGILAGGLFGISLASVPALKNLVLINPIEEPMKMLYLSFFLGIVHMLFGIGIKMVGKIQEGMIADGIFDNLFWMIFLVFLAPLGFAGILDGDVPPGIMDLSKWGALVMAAAIFVTGGRKKNSFIMKILGGLAGFYDIVGYFGDVLSYARLLALGLATSAIAMAVNDIAGMVRSMPFYTGYVAMALILAGGHLFNLAVNSLGGFVHSARLQYLEFFSKFFTGGGKPFKPFRSERRYSVIQDEE